MKIQLRNDTTPNWESYNPILAPGEVGVDTSEGKIKVGDGSTSWLNLPYIGSIDLSNYVDLTSSQNIYGMKTFNRGLSTPNIYSPGTSGNVISREMVGADTFRVEIGDTAKTTEVRINALAFTQNNHKFLADNDIATTSAPGIVQPDGTTITINNGIISSVGGGGGSTYTAGNGIDITNDVISIDTSVVATQSDIPTNYVTIDTQQNITGTKRITNIELPISSTDGIKESSYSKPILTSRNGYTTIGDNSSMYSNLILAGMTITTKRNGESTTYTNIDSGNITTYLPTATSSSKGIVQPDGTTIDIDSNGVISVDPTGLTTFADVDASNFTDTGKVELSSYGMPSNTLINLSLGVSGSSYTAPANGYLLMSFSGTANSAYAEILCYTGDNPQQNVTSNASTTLSGGWGRLMCPCKTGDVFNIYYGGNNFTVHNFEFVYAVGSESEAN